MIIELLIDNYNATIVIRNHTHRKMVHAYIVRFLKPIDSIPYVCLFVSILIHYRMRVILSISDV